MNLCKVRGSSHPPTSSKESEEKKNHLFSPALLISRIKVFLNKRTHERSVLVFIASPETQVAVADSSQLN